MSERYGATQKEWDWAAYHFGADILPAVGDPDPSIQRSKGLRHLDSLAKTPSMIGASGAAHGISGWVLHTATPEQVLRWKQDPALNVLLNTRNIRAIDIDIDDQAASDALEAFIVSMLGVKPPVRTRADSGKRTLLIRLEPNPIIRKRVIRVKGRGAIEFLANGQQTAVFGTHPSGARFEVRDANAGIPVVPIETAVALWDALRNAYDNEAKPLIVESDAAAEFIIRNGGANQYDHILRYLDANGWLTGGEASGVVNVRCPNEAEHTTQSSGSSTSYMPAGLGGKDTGGFKCLHSHCEHINTPSFLQLIGYTAEEAATAFTPTAVVAPETAPLTVLEESLSTAITAPRPDALGFRRGKKGELVKGFANLMEILRTDKDAVAVRYDEFTHMLTVSTAGGEHKPVDDDDISAMRELIERRYELAFSADEMRQAVSAVAKSYRYDSAIEWALGLKWDGIDRLSNFAHTILHCVDSEYHRAAVMYAWIAAAARILHPGVKADMSLVLISPRQGTGKSSFIKAMSPFEDWHTEMGLDENGADQARIMRGKVVIELPEMKGLSARDVADIKAFMSRAEEEFVPKYKEFTVTLKRRCIFFGTENRPRFLTDPTGNRRFLPVHVAVGHAFIDWPKMRESLEQYWAQAIHIVRQFNTAHDAVEHYSAAARSLAGPYVAAATQLDPWHGTISEFIAGQNYDAPISISAIASALLQGGPSALDLGKARRIRDTMTTLCLEETGPDVWVKRDTRLF